MGVSRPEQGFTRTLVRNSAIGAAVGLVLVVAARVTHFPVVFQVMFFLYAMLGAFVFILLDAPSMKRLEGGKAVVGLVLFYLVMSGVYIGGAASLPQYDPEIEKGKIEKVLKARRARTQLGKSDELIAHARVLNERAAAIERRIKALGGGVQVAVEAAPAPASMSAAGNVFALGKEQWELQECYNCHKLFGKGGKKRGPELDNIGNLMTPAALRQKILDPKSWMAEGFEKQYKKGKMPDKYKDLMFDEEIDALVVFLSSLKDVSVKTPKPVKMP